jgi:hypothetical protein
VNKLGDHLAVTNDDVTRVTHAGLSFFRHRSFLYSPPIPRHSAARQA